MKSFMLKAGLASMVLSVAVEAYVTREGPSRSIASTNQLEFHLQNARISSTSRILADDLKSLFVRITFSGNHVVELAKDRTIALVKGEDALLDLKVPVNPAWIRNDELDFKIEFVSRGFVENVIVRCSHVSKEVTQFNRTLQCVLPGESTPFLSFRIAKPGEAVPAVAKQ